MKKSFFLVAIIVTSILFFSCSESTTSLPGAEGLNPDVPVVYFQGKDTTFSYDQFQLFPYSKEVCGNLVTGKYWKPVGAMTTSVREQGQPVPSDSLKKWFGKPDTFSERNRRNNDSFNGMPDWFKKLFWFLLAVLLIAIVVGLILWIFFENLKRNRNQGQQNSNPAVSSFEKVTAEKSGGSSHSAQRSTIDKDDYSGIAMIISELKKGAAGGTVQLGALIVSIPSVVPDVTVVADRGAKVDIDINIKGDNITTADMVDVHEGDDHRSYSRQSGGSKDQSQKGDEKK